MKSFDAVAFMRERRDILSQKYIKLSKEQLIQLKTKFLNISWANEKASDQHIIKWRIFWSVNLEYLKKKMDIMILLI